MLSGVVDWVDIDTNDPTKLSALQNDDRISTEAKNRLLSVARGNWRENLSDGIFVSLQTSGENLALDTQSLVNLRILICTDRIVSVRSGRVLAVEDIHRHLAETKSTVTPMDVFAFVTSFMAKRLESIIADIDQDTEELENLLFDHGQIPKLPKLDELRREIFRGRRLLTSLRHVIIIIASDPMLEVDKDDNAALMKSADHVSSHLENLDNLHARAQALQDQIDSHLTANLSRSNFNLAIVATVFLPLTFVSGLLGMNVSGIPDTHNPWAFWSITGTLLLLAVGLWIVLYWQMRK